MNDVRILRVENTQLGQFYVALAVCIVCGPSENENFLGIVMTTAYSAIYSLFPSWTLRCVCPIASEFVNYRLDDCFVSFRPVSN